MAPVSKPQFSSRTALEEARKTFYNPNMPVPRRIESKPIINPGAVASIVNPVSNVLNKLTGFSGIVEGARHATKVVREAISPPNIKDIIFSELNSDNISDKLDLTSVETIMQYVNIPDNETVNKIKQQLVNHNAQLGKKDLENSDLSTIVHIIIDYMYSDDIDLSDTSYDERVLTEYFYEKAKKPRPDGLLDPEGVSNVAEMEFKARVPQMSIKDFEKELNSAGLFGLLAPIYRENTPYVAYNKIKADEIAAAMPDAKRIIEAELLQKYTEITKRKLMAEYERLQMLQKANQATKEDSDSLEELNLIVTGQRMITNESRKAMLAPFIQEQSERIAQQALLGLGANMSGGKKKTRKSKKSLKTKSKPKHKKSKTYKKSKKSRK
jgi:hypothetical protein